MRIEPSREKRAVLEGLLAESMVLITLDACYPGVVVPSALEQESQLRLNLSYRFGLPMDIDPWGIRATLTFNGVPFACELPWPSIYMIVSHATGQPVLFPEDMPDATAGEEPAEPDGERPSDGKRVASVTLVAVEGEQEAAAAGSEQQPQYEAPPAPEQPPPRPRRRGHLRLVK